MRPRRVAVGGGTLAALAASMFLIGCAPKTPQEVTDLNRDLGKAKDACASVYAIQDLKAVQGKVDGMNRFVDEGEMRKARKGALALGGEVVSLRTKAEAARAGARQDAEAALARAEEAVGVAGAAGAGDLARAPFSDAQQKLAQARGKAADPCALLEAARLAREAAAVAEQAGAAALAEKKRREEEEARRRAEEEARRRAAEEEARRRAEEEALRAHPPTYVVQKGDHLWKISGMEKIYKGSRYWPLIYDANREEVSDPDLVYPGQELSIPRGASDDEMYRQLLKLWRELL